MKNISKILKIGVIATAVAVFVGGGVFAKTDWSNCVGKDHAYEGLSTNKEGDYNVKCVRFKDGEGSDDYVTLYGKSQADCADASTLATNPEKCNGNDLNSTITLIINGIIFVIGIVAVVMIILGGITYATSQGDPGKVKKGKDTILYGIIGLVVALLAYAIVTFVLGALKG
jgi:hypothetical protein